MHHYTYYSYEEWGRGYIGRRTCKCLPKHDSEYFGSFSDKTFNPTYKVILQLHSTIEEAIAAEIKLHAFYQVDKNPHFANRAKQTSVGFTSIGNWKGLQHKHEIIEKISSSLKGRRWWNNGERQVLRRERPGKGWERGTVKGPTPRLTWWNNGYEEKKLLTTPYETAPKGWKRGRLKREKPKPKLRLFSKYFRALSLPEGFYIHAKTIQKNNNLARLEDGAVWICKNYTEEKIKSLLRPSSKKTSFRLPEVEYKKLNSILAHKKKDRTPRGVCRNGSRQPTLRHPIMKKAPQKIILVDAGLHTLLLLEKARGGHKSLSDVIRANMEKHKGSSSP